MSTELHEDAIRSLLRDAASDVDLSAELPARAERTYRRRQTRRHVTTVVVAVLAVVAGGVAVIARVLRIRRRQGPYRRATERRLGS